MLIMFPLRILPKNQKAEDEKEESTSYAIYYMCHSLLSRLHGEKPSD